MPIVLVFAAAAANSVTASGFVPPTVDQTIGSPRSSARTIAASVSAGFRPRIASPARSATTVAHLHGVSERVPRIAASRRALANHEHRSGPGISSASWSFPEAGAIRMHGVELTLGLLVAVAVLATVARMIRVPYPILLVLGGMLMALSPDVPDVVLAPDLV